ncbi:MAG TPA: ATP-grasp domain-containing protein [Verrucomicrobiae bacterium]|nr:ATP-grasp domain-containing protein [Verrucomicrobiae bacterium]
MKLYLPGAGARMIPAVRAVSAVSEVVVSINDSLGAGGFLADRAYLLPGFDEPGFAEGVMAIHRRERFDACLPVLDSALLFFARNWDRFRDAPFRLAMCDPGIVEMACDKVSTLSFLAGCGLPVPPTQTFAEYLGASAHPLPRFLKPRYPEDRDFGRAVYARLKDTADVGYWAAKLAGGLDRHIVQPLLEGDEFNIDFFCDASGDVRSTVIVRRVSGEPGCALSCGEIVPGNRFAREVRAVTEAVRLWGANQLQAIVAPGGARCFTELNARLTADSPFVQAAGVDYFEGTVRLLRGEDIDFPEAPRALRMVQWDHVCYFEKPPALLLPSRDF